VGEHGSADGPILPHAPEHQKFLSARERRAKDCGRRRCGL
jgi:hypothetical protein